MALSTAVITLKGGAIAPPLTRPSWSAAPLHAFWFDVGDPVSVNRVASPSSSEQVTIEDVVYQRDTGPSTVTDYAWGYTLQPRNRTTETITRSSSAPGVIVPSETDPALWTRVSTGSATLTISSATRSVSIAVNTQVDGGATVDTFLRFADDSLRASLHASVDSRLAGKSTATALKIYASQDHTNAIYVRNPSCWAADVDLTPISPWNSSGGNLEAGILVSPRHIIFAAHFQPAVGATFRFVTADNVVVTRTMTAKTTLPGYTSYYPDITVGVLDSDVPASISFARVLPDNWEDYLPGGVARVPAIVLDQEEKALVADLYNITDQAQIYGAMVSFERPTDAQRLAFYEDIIGGDSGNPACLIVGTQLVLLNVWTFGGSGQGTSVTYWKSALNTIMTALGGGYQLTDADLSAFPSYA